MTLYRADGPWRLADAVQQVYPTPGARLVQLHLLRARAERRPQGLPRPARLQRLRTGGTGHGGDRHVRIDQQHQTPRFAAIQRDVHRLVPNGTQRGPVVPRRPDPRAGRDQRRPRPSSSRRASTLEASASRSGSSSLRQSAEPRDRTHPRGAGAPTSRLDRASVGARGGARVLHDPPRRPPRRDRPLRRRREPRRPPRGGLAARLELRRLPARSATRSCTPRPSGSFASSTEASRAPTIPRCSTRSSASSARRSPAGLRTRPSSRPQRSAHRSSARSPPSAAPSSASRSSFRGPGRPSSCRRASRSSSPRAARTRAGGSAATPAAWRRRSGRSPGRDRPRPVGARPTRRERRHRRPRDLPARARRRILRHARAAGARGARARARLGARLPAPPAAGADRLLALLDLPRHDPDPDDRLRPRHSELRVGLFLLMRVIEDAIADPALDGSTSARGRRLQAAVLEREPAGAERRRLRADPPRPPDRTRSGRSILGGAARAQRRSTRPASPTASRRGWRHRVKSRQTVAAEAPTIIRRAPKIARNAARDLRYGRPLGGTIRTRYEHLGAHDVGNADYDDLALLFAGIPVRPG